MRRRLTVAILVLLAATMAVTTAASYILIRRAAIASAQQQLAGQARAISRTLAKGASPARPAYRRELDLIASTGAFAGIAIMALYPEGSVTGQLPTGVALGPDAVRSLENGRQVTGHTASLLVYSAIPTDIKQIVSYTPVLVITRQARDPVNGIDYFLPVGIAGLIVAAIVAAALARRFTRPIGEAVETTRRIAAGDLDATVSTRAGEVPELAQLGEAINAMGANLVRAREQERQFILSVSHELRTPLTSIRGYADAVLDGATDDPTAAAAVIGTEARRLERLVQDLLDLARLDADRFSMELSPVDASQVVRQVADGFGPTVSSLGLAVVSAPGTEEPLPVLADRDRLGQIVANLLENASAFAGTEIVVGTGVLRGAPSIWVTDDGPGIPHDQLPLIFERHFTSDRGRGRRSGFGLGLAIVSELAAAMGATVRAESPVTGGRGTRVTVAFHTGTPRSWSTAPGPGPSGAPHDPGTASDRPLTQPAVVGRARYRPSSDAFEETP